MKNSLVFISMLFVLSLVYTHRINDQGIRADDTLPQTSEYMDISGEDKDQITRIIIKNTTANYFIYPVPEFKVREIKYPYLYIPFIDNPPE